MAETAPAVAAPPAKAPKKKSAAKAKKAGPGVGELIVKAVSASKERSGVSLAALKKALAAGGYDVEKNNSRVKLAIKSLVTKGVLLQVKGTGASGSFKISKKQAETKKKPAKKAAPKAKKPAAAKKPKSAAAKKPAAKKSPKKAKAPKRPRLPNPRRQSLKLPSLRRQLPRRNKHLLFSSPTALFRATHKLYREQKKNTSTFSLSVSNNNKFVNNTSFSNLFCNYLFFLLFIAQYNNNKKVLNTSLLSLSLYICSVLFLIL
uniref:Histone H1 n=1 Tax=Cyprinus carpio TaxID=7962 RepID=A0A8C2J717_CYPCA